ncbi:glutaredoxin domain-containing protein [Leucobacter japonicus]|uniref:glutaredoxin domain-containing protein n=1 Tax=Leucobacter japonicus TaxID=1461259 RepID=UPI0006A78229|nr:glutaredoxin domain-containing protein [Leucobacter japonicus]
MQVTVYEKDHCQQCVMTKRKLTDVGVEFETASILDPVNLELVKGLGHMAAPVVVAGGEHWSGFRPDKIQELVKRLEQQEEVS